MKLRNTTLFSSYQKIKSQLWAALRRTGLSKSERSRGHTSSGYGLQEHDGLRAGSYKEDTTDFKIYIINNKGASFYYSQSEKEHTENLKQQAKEIHNDFIKIISEIEKKGFIYHIEYDEHGKTKYISRIRINVKENLEE